jgi:SAM-dependent methyltransferase
VTRWQRSEVPRGDDYDARWRKMAASGQNVHGEADLVEALLRESGGSSVLDAGCGTGRVAIELAHRGFSVVGVDADGPMLAAAKSKAPDLSWVEADLADLGSAVPGPFDLALLAGNVMIFLEPGTEGRALAALAARLSHGGLLVAGFSVRADRLTLKRYDQLAGDAGLQRVSRWATWDGEPFEGGDYAVSTHRLSSSPAT